MNSTKILSDDRQSELSEKDKRLVARAIKCLEAHYAVAKPSMSSPEAVKDYLRLQLTGVQYEVFSVIALDNRHQVIEYAELFRGTIDGASIYPREVVKHCLDKNAAAVIFAHNHPSGNAEPSGADVRITQRLIEALRMIDVRVLDHMIIGSSDVTSFAERGLI